MKRKVVCTMLCAALILILAAGMLVACNVEQGTTRQYNVIFCDGETVISRLTVASGSPVLNINIPAAPEHDGERFVGWFIGESDVKVETGYVPTSTCVVYARYEQIVHYTLRFIVDGRTISTVTAEAGESIETPADPVKTGYDFVGWYLTSDGSGEPQQLPAEMPNADRTYYAKFLSKARTMTFDANAPGGAVVTGSVAPITVEQGEAIVIPDGATFVAEGWLFAGWTDSPNGKADLTQGAYRVGQSFTLDENVTLYACWLKGYTDVNGGSDMVYVGDSVVGFGSAVLVREGMEKKLGFANRDPDTGEIVGFTFYFDEPEGGDIIGKIAGDHFILPGAESGIFHLKSYIDGSVYVNAIDLDGYGLGTVTGMVGDMMKTEYGVYEFDPQYGDYMFVYIDPATMQPVPGAEEGTFKGFNFRIEFCDVPEVPDDWEDADKVKGYYYVQGYESGTFLQYANGEIKYQHAFELDGYGNARIFELTYDDANDEFVKGQQPIASGSYSGTDDYIDFMGEWQFTDGDETQFRFILSSVALDEDYYLPVYIVYDEQHSRTLTLDGGTDKLEFDGYGGAIYTSAGGKFEGLAVFGDTLCTLYIYDDEGYSDVLYFNVDWEAGKFSVSTDGYIVDAGVLIAYTGDSKNIIIPDGVTEIADEVFKDMDITSVTIPATVTKIGKNAFQNSYTLTRVTFLGTDPSFIADIDWAAAKDPFRWPAGNFVIVVPEEHKEAFKSAFSTAWQAAGRKADQYKVKGSVEVTLLPEFQVNEDGVLIAYNRPAGAEELVDLTIANGQTEFGGDDIAITAIGENVFKAATFLRSIDLGGVTKIGASAFENCQTLVSVKFTNVTEIGVAAFAGCTALEGEDGTISLPAIVNIGESAFSGCTSIKHVILGKDIKAIGNWAFREIATHEDDILYIEIEDGASVPTIVPDSYNGTTMGTFSGNVRYRIIVPTINFALLCYREPTWSKAYTRLIMQPGDEAGVYLDGSTALIMEGRAVMDGGSNIWLYEIKGTTIIFYSADADPLTYIVTRGTYEDHVIEFDFDKKHYRFKLANGSMIYKSEDNLYTMVVDDPKELNPDTWSSSDKINHSITVLFNDTEVTLVMKGYNSKVINDFLDKDGKHYKFEITIAAQGNTFTYKKTPLAGAVGGDLDFGTSGKIENLTCDDGSVLSFHKLGSSVYVYGHLEYTLSDGSKLPSWSDYGQICTIEGNVAKFTRIKLNDKYDIVVIVNQTAGTFTYTCTKQGAEVKYNVTYASSADYTVSGLSASYVKGAKVTFTVKVTADGKEVDSVTSAQAEIAFADGQYSFTMPETAVTIVITLRDKEESSLPTYNAEVKVNYKNLFSLGFSIDKVVIDIVNKKVYLWGEITAKAGNTTTMEGKEFVITDCSSDMGDYEGEGSELIVSYWSFYFTGTADAKIAILSDGRLIFVDNQDRQIDDNVYRLESGSTDSPQDSDLPAGDLYTADVEAEYTKQSGFFSYSFTIDKVVVDEEGMKIYIWGTISGEAVEGKEFDLEINSYQDYYGGPDKEMLTGYYTAYIAHTNVDTYIAILSDGRLIFCDSDDAQIGDNVYRKAE